MAALALAACTGDDDAAWPKAACRWSSMPS